MAVWVRRMAGRGNLATHEGTTLPRLSIRLMPISAHRLAGAVGFLALAFFTALSVMGAPSEASFPGLNGRIACEAPRGPAPPSPNPAGLSRQEIVSVNPDGSDERNLTNNAFADLDPSYSPDGKRIAFASSRDAPAGGPANREIYVANNDGDLSGPDVQRLTYNEGRPLAGGAPSALFATDQSPSWSPDGRRIVFHSGRDIGFPGSGALNRFEIYTISSTPGQPGVEEPIQRLTENRVQDALPEWSPDGTKIVYQSLEGAANAFDLDIFTMNPDGSGKVNITNNNGTLDSPATPGREDSNAIDSFPTWSPDSQHIAFGSTRANQIPSNQNFEIYRMRRDGSGPTQLTLNRSGDSPGADTDYDHAPAWSPNGRRIVFTSGRNSNADTSVFLAYTMDADRGEAAGLEAVVETDIFANCTWQSLPRPAVTPPGRSYPLPAGPSAFADCPAGTANVIRGNAASNSIVGTIRGDRIFAGTGDDTVDGLAGNDCLDLGPGTDRGQGGDGADLIVGGLGRDRMSGNRGNDRLRGGSSGDRLAGGFGNDRLHGQSGSDRVNGERGRDRINGGSSNDLISAGSSGDRVAGDQGNDRINGNSGNDVVKGNSGRDRIKGSSGRDRLAGGSGNDRSTARDGRRDRVNCGSGRERVLADRSDRVARNCERVRRRR